MDRREFLRLASAAPLSVRARAAGQRSRIAYVGVRDALHVYTVGGERWMKRQEILCDSPSCLVRHPVLPVLYAANEVDSFKGRPAGAVSVYQAGADGQLSLLQEKELSLSATLPRAMAISRDGSLAIVAGTGGGSYNLFGVEVDGRLGPLQGVLKETGCGRHPELQTSSHPEHVLFDERGHVLGADSGTDRIHVLVVQDGSLQLQRRYQAEHGSGPGHAMLHGTGRFLAASHRLGGLVSVHRYDPARGRIGEQIHQLRGSTVALQTHRSLLAVQNGSKLNLYHWSGHDGRMRQLRSVEVDGRMRAGHFEESTLTAAVGDEVRRLEAAGWQRPLATCLGLRCLLWA